MPAADYTSRLTWYQFTRTTDATTGEEKDTHTNIGFLWCSVDDVSGRRQADVGATQTGAAVEIRVRNYPAVDPRDVLKDEYYGFVYILESVRFGSDELIIEAHRNDVLQDTDVPLG